MRPHDLIDGQTERRESQTAPKRALRPRLSLHGRSSDAAAHRRVPDVAPSSDLFDDALRAGKDAGDEREIAAPVERLFAGLAEGGAGLLLDGRDGDLLALVYCDWRRHTEKGREKKNVLASRNTAATLCEQGEADGRARMCFRDGFLVMRS